MMIYNKKEQVEQVKLQNVNFEERKITIKWNGTKSCGMELNQGDKQIKKLSKGNGDSRVRSYPVTFITCEKEFKKA